VDFDRGQSYPRPMFTVPLFIEILVYISYIVYTRVHDGREKRMTRNVFHDRSGIEIQFVNPPSPPPPSTYLASSSALDSLEALNASSGTVGSSKG